MQVTIEIPDELAERLNQEREQLAKIIARGLRQDWPGNSALTEEVITFLARGPDAEEIVAFRPSEASAERVRELLDKNRQGTLKPAEEEELDRIESLNHLFTLIKAHARLHLQGAA
jgi:hypothetical protein